MSTERQVSFDDEAFLAENPVFTLDDLVSAMGRPPRARCREWLKYHLGTGRLRLVERRIYAAVPPGTPSQSYVPDPFLVGAAARGDAVFGYHAALQLLGAGHSVWNVVDVLTAARRRPIELTGARVAFRLHPTALRTRGWDARALRTVHYRGKRLRATAPERTLVDGFRKPHLVGGLEELVESAAGFASLDLAVLKQLLEAYDQKSLWAAVGWFLEHHRAEFAVDETFLEDLEQHRPVSPHYLPRGRRGFGGVHFRRWNLVLPDAAAAVVAHHAA